MSFFEKLQSFLTLVKESNFDLAKIYSQDPNGIYVSFLVILVILLIIYYLINRSIKISTAVKLVSKIQNSTDLDDYNSKLSKIVVELPKRGIKVATSLNEQKNEILNQELALLKSLNINEKIKRYEEISAQYVSLAQNSKKFKIEELTSFYEEKSKSLLEDNLAGEIEKYYNNARFDESDVENINSIASYATRSSNPTVVINPLLSQINRLSFGFNLDLFKFITSLDKNQSKDIYKACNEKFKNMLTSGEGIISDNILNYMMQNDRKEEVYSYLSTLTNKAHLKALYNTMFSKSDNIDLDLAFVANNTVINADYKSHIDSKLTENWKDLGFIKHVINSDGVLETIGHIDYRNVLERIEKLETQDENNKAIAQALEIARRAEAIALEAKTLARSK